MGEIPSEAWSRWLTYAARVRDLSVFQKTDIDPSIWTTIFRRSQGTPILPNLRALSILIWGVPDAVPAILALAAPSLRSVSLSFQRYVPPDQTPTSVDAAIAGMMLQELSIKSPGLSQLFVHHNIIIDRHHLAYLSRFSQLEVLDIDHRSTFDETLLLVLANFRSLTRFNISILLRDSTEPSQIDLKDGFQNLARLDLRGSAPDLVRVILASSMPQLKQLCLAVIPPLDSVHSSLASICQHIGPHVLTCFRVQLCGLRSSPPLLMALLEPLLPFASLEELEFLFEEHLPIRDDDLERFARAWPKLRTLVLMQFDARRWFPDDTLPGSVVRPTMRGLVELARGCPVLDRLRIPDLDASTLPQGNSVPLLGNGLLHLCISNLVGADDEEKQFDVAVALDRLFPGLNLKFDIHEMPQYGVDDNPPSKESENIARLLRAMQVARTHYPGGVRGVEQAVY